MNTFSGRHNGCDGKFILFYPKSNGAIVILGLFTIYYKLARMKLLIMHFGSFELSFLNNCHNYVP